MALTPVGPSLHLPPEVNCGATCEQIKICYDSLGPVRIAGTTPGKGVSTPYRIRVAQIADNPPEVLPDRTREVRNYSRTCPAVGVDHVRQDIGVVLGPNMPLVRWIKLADE